MLDGESNVCRRVLLDTGRAKAHKVGYYLCKSRAAGKTSSVTSAEPDPSAGLGTTRRTKNTMLISVGCRYGAEVTANLNRFPIGSHSIGQLKSPLGRRASVPGWPERPGCERNSK